ncbi:MAG: LptE family protein [Aureliella sp.]
MRERSFLRRRAQRAAAHRAAKAVALLIAALLAPVAGVSIAGCAGYQVGAASLYRSDVRTIYVPIIRNDTWRPELGVELTEALQKAIQQRTPFRLVNDPSADSVLTCRVVDETKRVITETRNDDPRALRAKLTVQLTWVDRQGNVLMENRFIPSDDVAFLFSQSVDFVPEAGQSISTAYLRAIQRLADEIVGQMEVRW